MPNVVTRTLVAVIRFYQATIGQIVGGNCRFHPSCSEFAEQAIRCNGAARGTRQALWRIMRCGPWSSGGVDYPIESHRSARKGVKEALHG